MSFEGLSSDLFIRDPLTKEAARVRESSLQVIGAFFSIQEKFTGNNSIGQQFLLAHTPVLTNVLVEITTDGTNWTTFSSFTVAGQTITTTAAIPASPANNVRVTYFIAKINTAAVITSPSLDQQINQLSTLIVNTDLVSPNVAFQVEQMSSIIAELQGLSITIGDVDVNTDELETLTRDSMAANSEGLTNVILASVEGFTNLYLLLGQEISQLSQLIINTASQPSDAAPLLAHEITQLSTALLYGSQQVSQLSQIEINQVDNGVLLAQEVVQLSDIQARVSTEMTQLSVWQSLQGLSIDVGDIDVNTDELETLSRISIATIADGFTNVQNLVAQEVSQLSQVIINTGTAPVDVTPVLSHQVEQLSTLELYGAQGIGQLSDIQVRVSTETTQLSVWQSLQGLSIDVGDIDVNTDELETLSRISISTVADGFTQTFDKIQSSTSSLQDGLTNIVVLSGQQVSQLSDIQVRVATETTQLSVLQSLNGLSIDIGDIDVNTDDVEMLLQLQTATTAAGFTDTMSILSQEVSQLSQIITNTGAAGIDTLPVLNQQVTQLSTVELYLSQQIDQLSDQWLQNSEIILQLDSANQSLTGVVVLEAQEVSQLSDIQTRLATEVTQLSVLQSLDGLSIDVGDIDVNTDELEGLARIQIDTTATGLTNVMTLLNQEVGQLSQIITNTSVAGINTQPLLSHQIEQLSTLELYGYQGVGQLSNLETLSSQQVTQLSNLNVSVSLDVAYLTTVDLPTIDQITQLSTSLLYGSQQIAQLSQIEINQIDGNVLLAQQVVQLSDIEVRVSTEMTQLSVLQELQGLSVDIGDIDVNTDELELLSRIQISTTASGFTDVITLLNQEVSQLSQVEINQDEQTVLLSQEVSQLSTKIVQESHIIGQLTTLELYGYQQVSQLSDTYTILDGISIIDGRVLVSQEPPAPPPSTTSVIRTAQSVMGGTADNVYTITNGKTLIIQRFRGGSAAGGNGSKIEIYYDPNGTGVGMTLIDAGYCNGNNFIFDESSSQTYVGNGTRAIRMRRTRFGAGTLEIYGRWDGYE